MRTYKISIILLFFISFNLKICTFYLTVKNNKDQKTEPIFKARVFLDNLDYSKKNRLNSTFERIALAEEIDKSIKKKKSVIASTSLFNSLIESRYYKKTLKKLFSNKQSSFNIFATKDKNFIILIPTCEHPEIKKARNLARDLNNLGLNFKKMAVIRIYNKHVSACNIKKLLENPSVTKKTNIKNLKKFFLKDKLLETLDMQLF